MDLLETGMEGDSFTVVLDKGTLDALASEDNEESRQRAISYFRVSFFRGLCHPGYSLNFNWPKICSSTQMTIWLKIIIKKISLCVTPAHIQPEWYILFAYAILRSIPNKLGGVIALVSSILILISLPFTFKPEFRGLEFYSVAQPLFWSWVSVFLLLTWIGERPVEEPYIVFGQILTCLYFSYFLFTPIMININDKII